MDNTSAKEIQENIVKVQLTKEFVEAELAKGKSASQIEREQGMRSNSIFYWLKKWGLKSTNQQSRPQEDTKPLQLVKQAEKTPVIEAQSLSKEVIQWALERVTNELKINTDVLRYDQSLLNYGETYRERVADTERRIAMLKKYEQELRDHT